MTTDTSEKGLESLIHAAMTGVEWPAPVPTDEADEEMPPYGGTGWLAAHATDYVRAYAGALTQLRGFLTLTQPDLPTPLELHQDGPARRKFLARLQGEVSKRGVIDVLGHGIKHGPDQIDLFFRTPSPR